jgi:hypothetical protein
VFNEVTATLRALLRADPALRMEARFDAPGPSWLSTGDTTRLGLFLHDVREDLSARVAAWQDERDEDGRIVARRAPSRRYRLGYLVTAWSSTVDAEQELLGAALNAFVRGETVPVEHLTPALRATALPVTLAVAHPDLPAANTGLWRAFGIPPRTTLDLVVTTPLLGQATTDLDAAPEEVTLGVDPGGPPPPAPTPAPAGPRKRIDERV